VTAAAVAPLCWSLARAAPAFADLSALPRAREAVTACSEQTCKRTRAAGAVMCDQHATVGVEARSAVAHSGGRVTTKRRTSLDEPNAEMAARSDRAHSGRSRASRQPERRGRVREGRRLQTAQRLPEPQMCGSRRNVKRNKHGAEEASPQAPGERDASSYAITSTRMCANCARNVPMNAQDTSPMNGGEAQ
jgi:hypothetical protein